MSKKAFGPAHGLQVLLELGLVGVVGLQAGQPGVHLLGVRFQGEAGGLFEQELLVYKLGKALRAVLPPQLLGEFLGRYFNPVDHRYVLFCRVEAGAQQGHGGGG